MEKQLKQFLRFLEKDKKASNNTLQSYKRDLEKFQTYLDEHNIKYLKVTEQDIKDYLNYLVEQNKKEIEVLKAYMPEQLTEEELIEIIDKVFNEVKPTSSKDMGLVMKSLSPLVKGKADMSLVNKIVKEKLN